MGRRPCHESGYSPDLELGSMNISDLGCLIISMQVQEQFIFGFLHFVVVWIIMISGKTVRPVL